ncbi:MAG: T9SS type A sorting domain-containing protein, partial [Ignavibacteriae bacterium]|nr:T9SS type A sorting domain-containing protein [Ignavibacteriota bacterium]
TRAETWELPGGCVSYEGGPGLPSGGGKNNLANQILANRTYKMKEIIKKCFGEGWFDIGGGLAMYFTLSSGYNRYGCWGITDDYTKPDRNYKMQAIRELIGPLTDFSDISIENNYTPYAVPNPLSAETEIVFNNRYSENTVIEIYDILSRRVAAYPLGLLDSGKQKARINMNGFQDGFYYFIIKSNCETQKGMLVLQR